MGALIGTSLPLTTLGALAYASPIAGRLFLQGETDLPQIINEIVIGHSLVIGFLGAILYVGGCTSFGIGIWQAREMNKWAGVSLALHGLLIAFGFGFPPLLVLSWALLCICGIIFAVNVQNDCVPSR
jgi:hypothetical protein